jgi:hypothetical protein
MSNGPTSDPIFPDKPLVPPAPGHPGHEQHHEGPHDWVVIHRGGEGSKEHVKALERKLIKADIDSRVEHDDDHKVVLEVHPADEAEAKQIIGAAAANGKGERAHMTREEHIEAEEKAELRGPFKASTISWVLIVVAAAVIAYLVFWMFIPH